MKAKNTRVITAYGSDQDREKLSLLAQKHFKSASEMIIALIREKYTAVFGDNTGDDKKT